MKRARPRTIPPEVSNRTSKLDSAFDELRFGAARTLNLREILPTPELATARTESWLREHQVAGSREVLVITGRGNSSPGGVSPVRQAVQGLARRLRRAGVVESVSEHNPGAFVVLLAPVARLFDSPRSKRHPTPPTPLDTRAFKGLPAETVDALRDLAERSLDQLGIRSPTPAVLRSEMERRFSLLCAGLGETPGRELRLRGAIAAALLDLEDQ